jgi:hypothetical protein
VVITKVLNKPHSKKGAPCPLLVVDVRVQGRFFALAEKTTQKRQHFEIGIRLDYPIPVFILDGGVKE